MQDGGDADGGPDRSTSGSDPALPPVHMDPTSQMRETPSLDISNDISRTFVRLESLVEMIAVHVGLVEPEDPATTPEDPSAASEPATPVGDEDENIHENEAISSMPPRRKRKLAKSSGGEDNDIFFLSPGSSPKTFPVDDSISKYVSSCFYTYLKDDDLNKVTESDLKPDSDFFQAPIVNSSIKDQIYDPGVLRGDSFIFKFQSQLISGANGILNLWQHIKDGKDPSHADVLETLQRSLVLIGSSFAGLSSFRRYRFKSSLSPEFQSLVKEPEGDFSPSKFLFGDDLSSKIKNLSEENKLIRKITVPRKQPPQKFKPQYRAGQQSAKNSNRFSNRRVVFKQGNFRKQKQDASRIKTSRNNSVLIGQNRMNLFQSTGRTLFYLKNWGQLTTDSSVPDIVKGYKLRFKAHPHQFYRPITNPKSSKEFQAIKQEVNYLLSKGAIKQIPKSQAKFVSRLFTVPKKSGGLRPVINLKTLNQFLHLQTFKMEGLSGSLRAQRLYDHNRICQTLI